MSRWTLRRAVTGVTTGVALVRIGWLEETMAVPVERALRRLVADGVTHGTLGPGARLPTERDLVDELGAPRSAIRRALDALEQDGIVVRHVGRGTFLADQLHPSIATAPSATSPAGIR